MVKESLWWCERFIHGVVMFLSVIASSTCNLSDSIKVYNTLGAQLRRLGVGSAVAGVTRFGNRILASVLFY